MNGKQTQLGWYGETLDAVLDRRPVRQVKDRPAPVGYDPRELAKLLG